jgi:hypothetical protein
VHREERVQQRFVRKAGWVEGDFDDFRMAGAVGTDFFIGWVFEVAAFVSYGCIDNTGKLTESGFYAPKTSCTKCCFLLDALVL